MGNEKMSEWQTIDTAPDDGREIIVYFGKDNPKIVETASADGVWWRSRRSSRRTPTHWQPLPQPPSTSQEKSNG